MGLGKFIVQEIKNDRNAPPFRRNLIAEHKPISNRSFSSLSDVQQYTYFRKFPRFSTTNIFVYIYKYIDLDKYTHVVWEGESLSTFRKILTIFKQSDRKEPRYLTDEKLRNFYINRTRDMTGAIFLPPGAYAITTNISAYKKSENRRTKGARIDDISNF